MALLEIKNVNKYYSIGDGSRFQALKDINLSMEAGGLVSVVGESGSGKSTLMNLIGGLDTDFEGSIHVAGHRLEDMGEKELSSFHKYKVGFVFQSFNLIPHLSVLDNVTMAMTLSNVGKDARRKQAENTLSILGLEDQINKQPNQLSGGQKQRVAIARALVNNPEIIIADEPTGSLDSETSDQVLEIFQQIAASGKLVLLVTHSERVAAVCSRIITIADGAIINDEDYPERLEAIKSKKIDDGKMQEVQRSKKGNLSFGSAFLLSLKNMTAKWTRNTMIAIGGSIGIMSIILMLSLGDKYFTNEDIPNVSVDRDLIVYQDESDGLMMRELENYYETLWEYEYTWKRPLRPREDLPASFEKIYQTYHARYEKYSASAPNRAAEIDWRRRSFPINRAYYVHNSLHHMFKEPRVWKNMVNLMDQAQESIVIQTPYVVPAQEMIDQWQAAVDPEVEMTLLTNSMNSANNIPGYAATANHRKALIESPMRYYEYQPREAQMHMKLFVIDESISAVGTFNLDQRSANLTAESMLVIDSPEFTQHLLEEMGERYMVDSWEITPDNQDYNQQTIGRQIVYQLLSPVIKWIEPMI